MTVGLHAADARQLIPPDLSPSRAHVHPGRRTRTSQQQHFNSQHNNNLRKKHQSASNTTRTSSNHPEGHAMTSKDWASHFWITLVDEEGEAFYANPQTGERKWTIPTGSLVLPRSADGEWYELWSDEHNLPYYYHTVKNETTWYKPDGFVIPLKAVQRFSAGRRFSLTLDSGSSVVAPEAPDVPITEPLPASHTSEEPASPSEEQAHEPDLLNGKCDPFYAAVFQCITGRGPESPPERQSIRSRTVSATERVSRSRTASGVHRLQRDPEPSIENVWAEQSLILDESDDLDHINVSAISLSSSNGTVSTPNSTPLDTPRVVQDGFSRSLASNEGGLFEPPESPYTGIEEMENTDTESLASARVTLSKFEASKIKTASTSISPLRITKRNSMLELGDPLALRRPAQKLTKPSLAGLVRPTRQAPEPTSPTPFSPPSPAFTQTPSTPRSASSFFSTMFSKIPASPDLSMDASTIKACHENVEADAVEKSSLQRHPVLFTPNASKASKSPQTVKTKDVKSPTFNKVKKMFASSQGLSKASEDSPKRGVPETLNASQSSSFLQLDRTLSLSPGKKAAAAAATVPQDLLDEIHRFSFNQYAEEHFAAGQKSVSKMFSRRSIALEQRKKWQAADLEMPILQLNKQLRWDAQQCFTHLQRVMGDRPLKDSDVRVSMEDANAPSSWDTATCEEARKLLALGVNVPELRDEIYVQLLCQLTDNPSAISIYRGYQLLQVLLVVFPPSSALAPALRQFLLARRGGHPSSRLGFIARYALVKFDDIVVKGPRGAVPTLFEVQAASEGAFQPSVFGETLQRVMALQSEAYPDAKIPIVLSFLADGVLALGGLKTPGIFRVAGDLDKVKELRIVIDQGRYSFAGYEDPRIAASLFKFWLREMRDPLIPMDWYHQCMEAASSESRCVDIVQKLPSLNRRIVAFVISFLQIFAREVVAHTTLVSISSLAMIFTPCFFRAPAPSKTLSASASTSAIGTPDGISKVFNEARIEQQFILHLLQYLDVTRLEDEDDWIPTHGKHNSMSSSCSTSTTESSASIFFPASSALAYIMDVNGEGSGADSRPSLDSVASNSTVASRPSFGSTKRKNRFARDRTHTVDTTPSAGYSNIDADALQANREGGSAGLASSTSLPYRSRATTDSIFLQNKSQSTKDVQGSRSGFSAPPPLPLPDLPFIKPTIIVDEAD